VIAAGLAGSVDTPGRGRPDVLARALFAFAAALFVFLLFPPFLKGDVGLVHGFTGQELSDLFTPLVTMPLLVVAFEATRQMGIRARVVLIILVSIWVAGQGIHLATNAIGDLFPAGPEREAFYLTAGGQLDHWFDEVLSHWLWHVAWLGMLGMLLWVAAAGGAPERDRLDEASRTVRLPVVVSAVGGLIHGFTWFVVTDEAGTWPLAIPATVLLLVLGSLARKREAGGVISTFIVVGSALTILLYAIWIASYGWPPADICETFGC
jgi:hypothetical protein